MADAPVRKRPVSTSRTSTRTPAKAPAKRAPRAARIVEDEPASTNYALRLTAGLDDELPPAPPSTSRRGLRPTAPPSSTAEDTFSARLSEALQAISAAQSTSATEPVAEAAPQAKSSTSGGWLASLDKLPPIRLPIGPPIPWRIGLPVLVLLIVGMAFVGRPSSSPNEQPGVLIPPAPTYPVQQTAPLFATPQPTLDTAQTPAATDPTAAPLLGAPADPTAAPLLGAPAAPTATASAPVGVQDPGGFNFDFVDVGIKLIAVLALAYGSLMLLKRFGVGGASSMATAAGPSVRVVSSIALAPNRSVHVIRVPGGKTLLVGATPNSVNLLADLGEVDEDDVVEATSFLDALKGKIGG